MENVGPKWNLISRQSQGLKYDDVDTFSFSETVLAMNIGTGVLLKTCLLKMFS